MLYVGTRHIHALQRRQAKFVWMSHADVQHGCVKKRSTRAHLLAGVFREALHLDTRVDHQSTVSCVWITDARVGHQVCLPLQAGVRLFSQASPYQRSRRSWYRVWTTSTNCTSYSIAGGSASVVSVGTSTHDRAAGAVADAFRTLYQLLRLLCARC